MTSLKEFFKPFQRFSLHNINASALLFTAAILAMFLANSPWAYFYEDFLYRHVFFQIGDFNIFSHHGESMTVLAFVNDALMSLFFLLVGMEIKQEILIGELSSVRKAVFPIVAAFGGMIVPVLVFLLFCNTAPDIRGAAIPMATDIAFALSVLALLGNRVPLSLKIFLTALAVVDDIGGIIIIALFYSGHVAVIPLLLSILVLFTLYLAGKFRINSNAFYYIGGFIVWLLFLESGIHPTIAGVLVAFTIPARPIVQLEGFVDKLNQSLKALPLSEGERSPKATVLSNAQIHILRRIEATSDKVISPLQNMTDSLHPYVNYLILPLFAFVNAGVTFGSIKLDMLMGIPMGVFAGLFIGKTVGIFSFSYLFVKSGIGHYPLGMNTKNLFALSMLGGIGFTVSLFIANLSYSGVPEIGANLLNQAKLGVFAGSFISGVLGYFRLKQVLPPAEVKQ